MTLEHDPTPSDLPEPMPWHELAYRLQAEKLALREELDTARQHLWEAVGRADTAEARLTAIRGYLPMMDSANDADAVRALLDADVGGQ